MKFDDFLNQKVKAEEDAVKAIALLRSGTASAWERLQKTVKTLTAGKEIQSVPFEWTPFSNAPGNFLLLNHVALYFVMTQRYGIDPNTYEVQLGSYTQPNHHRIHVGTGPSPKRFQLTPVARGEEIAWKIGNQILGNDDLANQLAIMLTKYFEEN